MLQSGGYPGYPGSTGYNYTPNPQVQSWFNTVDKDRSGEINAKELQAALVNGQGKHFSDTACDLMIGMFDKDKTGTINVQEFEQLYAYINQWLTVFKNYDKDQSGSIEEQELAQGKGFIILRAFLECICFSVTTNGLPVFARICKILDSKK